MRNYLLIVEDDEIQRENLKVMLKELDNVTVLEASSVAMALELLESYRVDLFFLDQHLSDGTGIELGIKIRQYPEYKLTWIVFLTSHVQYMLEAFKEIHCYDYVLKPYSRVDILGMARELLAGKDRTRIPGETKPCLEITVMGIGVKLDMEQINFIEVVFRNCQIHTTTGVYRATKTPLVRMIEQCPEEIFVQSHRSFLVNIQRMERIFEQGGEWRIAFKDCTETALIGKTFKEAFFNRLGDKLVTYLT